MRFFLEGRYLNGDKYFEDFSSREEAEKARTEINEAHAYHVKHTSSEKSLAASVVNKAGLTLSEEQD